MSDIFLIKTLIVSLLSFSFVGYAQSATTQSAAKFLKERDERVFRDNNNYGVTYADVTGTPFWKNSYLNAILFENGAPIETTPVKINLFTNELYFLKENQELVLADNNVNKVVFVTPSDTVTFIRFVPNLFLNRKKMDGFVQVLNTGEYQLLKYIQKELLTSDSALSAKRYYFKETNYYFIRKGQKVEQIKKMDKENVLVHVPLSATLKEWIDANHLNFEKEKDIILFLSYYNSSAVPRN